LEKFNDYLLSLERLPPVLKEYLNFTGPHVEILIINRVNLHQMVVLELLNLFPNLKAIEMDYVRNLRDDTIEWDFKLRKIERVKMIVCSTEILRLLESLKLPTVVKATLSYWTQDSGVIEKFLKAQEKSLKKLTVYSNMKLPRDLKELRLEYFKHSFYDSNVPREFLRQQVDLKVLKITSAGYFGNILDLVWKLKNLEILELNVNADDNGLNNLYKLQKLKRLKISRHVSRNFLNPLQFGVFNDLEELDVDASFNGAFLESIREMKRITPNLKKIKFLPYSSDTINALLDTLENLESMEIDYLYTNCTWKIHLENVYPKIKYLHVSCRFDGNFSAEQFTKIFPNLEYLSIYCPFEVTESSLITVLSELKQLQQLYLETGNLKFNPEVALQCFRDYGKHLRSLRIGFYCDFGKTLKIIPGFEIWEKPGKLISIQKL
jgi:hypothetical protein